MPLFLTMLWLSGSPKWKQLIISNNYSWIYAIDTNSKKNVAISENNNIIKIILKAFVPKCPLTWYFNWVACEGNAQSKNGLYLYWTNLPEDFACPIPPSKRPSIFARSGRVISSHLADSKARSYWPYIYAEWLHVACAEAAETLPFHGTHGKSLNLLQFSPYMLKGFLFKKGIILFVDCPMK